MIIIWRVSSQATSAWSAHAQSVHCGSYVPTPTRFFLAYCPLFDPLKDELVYLQQIPDVVFRYHSSAHLIASEDTLPKYIAYLATHVKRVRNYAVDFNDRLNAVISAEIHTI